MRAAATLFVSAVRTAFTPAASSTFAGVSGRAVEAAGAALALTGASILGATDLEIAAFAVAVVVLEALGVAALAVVTLGAEAFCAEALAAGDFVAALATGAEALRGAAAVAFAAAFAVVFGAAFAALEAFVVPDETARVFVTFAPALDLACAAALFTDALAA